MISDRDLLTTPSVSQSLEKVPVDNCSKRHSFRFCSSLKWYSIVRYELSAIVVLLRFCPVRQLICALTGVIITFSFGRHARLLLLWPKPCWLLCDACLQCLSSIKPNGLCLRLIKKYSIAPHGDIWYYILSRLMAISIFLCLTAVIDFSSAPHGNINSSSPHAGMDFISPPHGDIDFLIASWWWLIFPPPPHGDIDFLIVSWW